MYPNKLFVRLPVQILQTFGLGNRTCSQLGLSSSDVQPLRQEQRWYCFYAPCSAYVENNDFVLGEVGRHWFWSSEHSELGTTFLRMGTLLILSWFYLIFQAYSSKFFDWAGTCHRRYLSTLCKMLSWTWTRFWHTAMNWVSEFSISVTAALCATTILIRRHETSVAVDNSIFYKSDDSCFDWRWKGLHCNCSQVPQDWDTSQSGQHRKRIPTTVACSVYRSPILESLYATYQNSLNGQESTLVTDCSPLEAYANRVPAWLGLYKSFESCVDPSAKHYEQAAHHSKLRIITISWVESIQATSQPVPLFGTKTCHTGRGCLQLVVSTFNMRKCRKGLLNRSYLILNILKGATFSAFEHRLTKLSTIRAPVQG